MVRVSEWARFQVRRLDKVSPRSSKWCLSPAGQQNIERRRLNTINVGIDVHKKCCQACLKDQDGHLIEELSLQNNPEGITQLRTLLTSYPEAKVALESTGNLWTRIYDELNAEPTLKVILTNPYKTRIIAEAKIKNDHGFSSPSRPGESRLGCRKLRPRP